MVFLIAIIPALFVFVGVMSASKSTTRAWAIIAVLLGIFTGNPAFMALDLVAVIIAYGLTSFAWQKPDAQALSPPITPALNQYIPPPILQPAPEASDKKAVSFWSLAWLPFSAFSFLLGGANLKTHHAPHRHGRGLPKNHWQQNHGPLCGEDQIA